MPAGACGWGRGFAELEREKGIGIAIRIGIATGLVVGREIVGKGALD